MALKSTTIWFSHTNLSKGVKVPGRPKTTSDLAPFSVEVLFPSGSDVVLLFMSSRIAHLPTARRLAPTSCPSRLQSSYTSRTGTFASRTTTKKVSVGHDTQTTTRPVYVCLSYCTVYVLPTYGLFVNQQELPCHPKAPV